MFSQTISLRSFGDAAFGVILDNYLYPLLGGSVAEWLERRI